MSEKHGCAKRVYGDRFGGRACIKTGTVERDGKWYCGTHDPVKVKEREAARNEKWDAEYKAQADIRHRAKLRAESGEMGIELARLFVKCTSPFGGGWSRAVPADEMNTLIAKAQAVIDKLEGK